MFSHFGEWVNLMWLFPVWDFLLMCGGETDIFSENNWLGKGEKVMSEGSFQGILSSPGCLCSWNWWPWNHSRLGFLGSNKLFIWWECFQNSPIRRKHDWEVSLFLCLNYTELYFQKGKSFFMEFTLSIVKVIHGYYKKFRNIK